MLAYKDSNLECRYQKPVCYQLHHRPIDFITAANLNQSFYPTNVFITFLFLTKFYNLRTLNTALLRFMSYKLVNSPIHFTTYNIRKL